MVLDEDLLNKLYDQWVVHIRGSDGYFKRVKRIYSRINIPRNQKFEDWLWGHQFRVVQVNKKRYLVYHGEQKYLTAFLLKYGGNIDRKNLDG